MSTNTLAPCLHCGALNRVDLQQASSKQPLCGKCHNALPVHDGIVELSADGLNKLIASSSLPVLVDFWAPWCGPCQAFAPIYAQAAQQKAGSVIFAKLNTEAEPAAGARFGIRGIPTLVSFKNGRERNRISGALPLQPLVQWVEANTL